MNRRDFLMRVAAGGALLTLRAPRARAIGPAQKARVLRVRYSGNWSVNASADQVLAEELKLRTSVDVEVQPLVVDLTSQRLYDSLFAVLAGDGPFSLSADERAGLKRWLGLGGFLLVDNAGRTEASRSFDASIRRELELLFPQTKIERVSPDHVIYRSFYRLDYPAGRAIHRPYIEGLQLGRRYAVVINPNDLGGALAKREGGGFANIPTPGGEHQREMAFRFGVNLMMYAACLHYKDDQVHLDYLLHKRKWKIRPPQ